MTPISPSSSPSAASGKSVWIAGIGSRPPTIGRPPPSPVPSSPPRAKAMSAWTTW